MTGREAMERRLREQRVRLVPKARSRLMRACGALIATIGNRRFMDSYWTTVARTIYYPTTVSDPLAHTKVLEHELVHVRQWARWNVLLWATYLLFPLPFGLAWFRWHWEREAYVEQIKEARDPEHEIERVVESLWTGYGWPWPKPWMRRWFRRKL